MSRASRVFSRPELSAHAGAGELQLPAVDVKPTDNLTFIGLRDANSVQYTKDRPSFLLERGSDDGVMAFHLPCKLLFQRLPWSCLPFVALDHGLNFTRKTSSARCRAICLDHVALNPCSPDYVCYFECAHSLASADYELLDKSVSEDDEQLGYNTFQRRKHADITSWIAESLKSLYSTVNSDKNFPPNLKTVADDCKIIASFCDAVSPLEIKESPCLCCGASFPLDELTLVAESGIELRWLQRNGISSEGNGVSPRADALLPLP